MHGYRGHLEMDDEVQKITVILEDGAFVGGARRDASAVDQIVASLDNLGKSKAIDEAAKSAERAAASFEKVADASKDLNDGLDGLSEVEVGWLEEAQQAERDWQKHIKRTDRIRERRKASAQVAEDAKALESMIAEGRKLPKELLPSAAPKQLSLATKLMQGIAKRFGPGAVKGIGDAATQFEEFAPVLAKIAPVAAGAAAAVAALTAIAGVAAIKFGASVIEAQAFREDVTLGLSTILRSRVEADKALKTAAKTAGLLGQSVVETSGQFLDLLAKGFDVGMVDRIVKSLADLATVDPKASLEGLTKVIGKAQATGRINMDILSELSTFGLEQGDVIRQIGKMLKKTDAEVIKALSSAGGIRGLGVEPILQAISGQVGGGAPGEAAAKKARDNISSLIGQIKQIPENVLFDLAVGPGMKDVKGAAAEILDFFRAGTESGERVRRVLAGVFNALSQGFFGRDISKGGGVKEGLDGILQLAEDATPAIKEAAGTARQLASAIGTVVSFAGKISAFANKVGGLTSVLNKASLPARVLSTAFMGPLLILPELLGLFGKFGDALGGIWDKIGGASIADSLSGIWDSVSTAASTAWERASEIGSSIVDGIVGGITGAVVRVTGAITGLAGGAIDSAKATLGIASPSAEFWAIGSNAGNSFADSMTSTLPSVEQSAAELAARSTSAAMGAALNPASPANGALAPVGTSLAGGGVIIQQVIVNVNGAKDARDASAMRAAGAQAAQEFARMLDVELRRRRLQGAA